MSMLVKYIKMKEEIQLNLWSTNIVDYPFDAMYSYIYMLRYTMATTRTVLSTARYLSLVAYMPDTYH